jgi:MFS family permease
LRSLPAIPTCSERHSGIVDVLAAPGFAPAQIVFLSGGRLRQDGTHALALILSSALVLDQVAAAGRPKLASLHFAGVGIGIATSAALIAALLPLGASWAAMWWASGAVSLLGAAAAALMLPGQTTPKPAPRALSDGRRDPRLGQLTVAYGLFGFGYVITTTFLVAIVRATPTIQDLEPVIWIVVGLAAAPSVMFWTFIGRRIGIPAAFATAALTEAAGVVASVIWPTIMGICLAAVLVGGTFMGSVAALRRRPDRVDAVG